MVKQVRELNVTFRDRAVSKLPYDPVVTTARNSNWVGAFAATSNNTGEMRQCSVAWISHRRAHTPPIRGPS